MFGRTNDLSTLLLFLLLAGVTDPRRDDLLPLLLFLLLASDPVRW